MEQNKNEIEYPISLETALKIVGSLKVKAIKAIDSDDNTIDKKELDNKILMYLQEERMLYGGNDYERLSVMDKVVNLYSPILKKEYLDSSNK